MNPRKHRRGMKNLARKSTIILLAFFVGTSSVLPSFVYSARAQGAQEIQGSGQRPEPTIVQQGSEQRSEPTNKVSEATTGSNQEIGANGAEQGGSTQEYGANGLKDKKDKSGDGGAESETQSLSSAPTNVSEGKTSNSSRITIDVDNVTGILSYRYKLTVPAGRNNMTPSVELVYNSEDKNNASPTGFGWSLYIPKIQRLNKKGTDTLYENNYFSSSLSGELKYISANDYGAKVDDGSYLDYEHSGDIWTVKAKDGTIYTFGETSQARLSDPSDPSKVYTWYLTKIQDANGNFISYSYYKDPSGNAIYPDSITYTNFGASSGIYAVNFIREDRSDTYTSYAAGFLVKTAKRIQKIEITTNGSLIRSYELGYTSGDNGFRSMLSSIAEAGINEAGVTTTLPDMTMAYTNGKSSLVDNPGINYPWVTWKDQYGNQYTTPFSFGDQHIKLMDVNGDGLKDIVKSYNVQMGTDHPIFWVLINTGNGWGVDNSWTQPTYQHADKNNNIHTDRFTFGNAVDVGDWNGDGKDDLILFWDLDLENGQHAQRAIVLLNNGNGWTQDFNVTTDVPTYVDRYGKTQNLYVESGSASLANHFIDLNGDGLLDYIHADAVQTEGKTYTKFAVLFNREGHLEWDRSITPTPISYQPNGPNDGVLVMGRGVEILDINGDGLVDFMYATNWQGEGGDHPGFWAAINTGHGWVQDTTITQPTYTYIDRLNNQSTSYMATSYGSDWRVMEVNGDNLPDLIRLWQEENNPGSYDDRKAILINTGHGWKQDDSLMTVENYTFTYNNNFYSDYPTSGSPVTIFFDMNGDGLDDIVNSDYARVEGVYYITQWSMKNTGFIANTLSDLAFPEGGSFKFSYKQTSTYTDGSGNLLNPNLPTTFNTLQAVTRDDGFGNKAETAYEYADGHYYFLNSYDRRFGGFGKTTITDPDGHKTVIYNHTGNGLQAGETGGDPSDGSFIGKIYKEQRYDSNDTLFEEIYSDWTGYDLGNGRDFVYKSRVVANSDGKETAIDYAYNTSTGNLMSEINYGKVITSSNTFSDTDADKQTTNYTYTTTGPTRVATSEKLNQSNGRINQQRFYYDGLILGQANKGNLTKEEKWKSSSTYINSQKAYNVYGLVASETDSRGYITTYSYDAYNLYPITVTNPLSQITRYVYDYAAGKPKEMTDPNGYKFQTTYDGLGRMIEEKQPDLTTPATLVAKTKYVYTDDVVPASVKKMDYLDDTNTADAYTYFDGLSRIIQERKEAESADTFSVKDFVYNNKGLLEKESLPYFSFGSSRTSPTEDSSLYISYVYDTLNRITSKTNAVGTETNSYDDWKMTTTDANGNAKDLYYDAYQRLIQVNEYNSGQTYTTAYAYSGAGDLLKITDALGNIRNFTYDGLGRRLTAEDLHNPADTTFGKWIYTYDNNGNITRKVDPKAQTINYVYDKLNRNTSEDYTGLVGTEVTYTYDTCVGGKGRLCKITKTGFVQNNEYNSLGQVKKETRSIDSVNYITQYVYDRLGNILTLANPDNSQVKYIYNSAGLLEKVQRKESADASFMDVATNLDHSPLEKITRQNYTNGSITINNYDAAKLYRLTSKITTLAYGASVQDISYSYDPVGNITRIIDDSQTNSAKIVDYAYDDLNRLVSATSTNAANGQNYTENYAYDAIGNITNKNGLDYSYDGNTGTSYANPNATTSISGTVQGESVELLPNPWHLEGTDAIEFYEGIDENALNGKESITITYNLHGFCAWGGDASAIIFDQDGWKFISLSDYGENCLDGEQTVTIPLSDFGVNTNAGLTGMFHTRFWYYDYYTVDILSAKLNGAGGGTVTTNYAYDNNGNLLTSSDGLSNSWDYNNRLTQTVKEGTTVSYGYDAEGERIKKTTSVGTEIYVSKYYEISSNGKKKKYIYANNDPIATAETQSGTTTIYYTHKDHLGGSSVITDSSGNQTELLDYYPYGSTRLDEKSSSFETSKKFTGKELDEETGLYYYGARYYDAEIGRFVSIDPVALKTPEKLLKDPQALNTYTYARNNPLIYIDNTGNFFETAWDLANVVYDAGRVVKNTIEVNLGLAKYGYGTLTSNQALQNKALNQMSGNLGDLASAGIDTSFDFGATLIPFVPAGVMRVGNKVNDVVKISEKYNWGIPGKLLDHTQRHGPDFGIKNAEDYAKKAQDFYSQAKSQGFEAGYNSVQKSLQFYDRKTNTFGAFDPVSGATKTFLKPSAGSQYINNLIKRGEWNPVSPLK